MTTHTVRTDAAELVQEDHLALKERLKAVQRLLRRADASPAELWPELRALELELAEHFRHEETGGFFSSIVETSPEAADRIAALVREHEQFRWDIGALKDACRVARFDPPQLARLVSLYAGFVRTFDNHEHKEYKLIQEATNRDLGAAD